MASEPGKGGRMARICVCDICRSDSFVKHYMMPSLNIGIRKITDPEEKISVHPIDICYQCAERVAQACENEIKKQIFVRKRI